MHMPRWMLVFGDWYTHTGSLCTEVPPPHPEKYNKGHVAFGGNVACFLNRLSLHSGYHPHHKNIICGIWLLCLFVRSKFVFLVMVMNKVSEAKIILHRYLTSLSTWPELIMISTIGFDIFNKTVDRMSGGFPSQRDSNANLWFSFVVIQKLF